MCFSTHPQLGGPKIATRGLLQLGVGLECCPRHIHLPEHQYAKCFLCAPSDSTEPGARMFACPSCPHVLVKDAPWPIHPLAYPTALLSSLSLPVGELRKEFKKNSARGRPGFASQGLHTVCIFRRSFSTVLADSMETEYPGCMHRRRPSFHCLKSSALTSGLLSMVRAA